MTGPIKFHGFQSGLVHLKNPSTTPDSRITTTPFVSTIILPSSSLFPFCCSCSCHHTRCWPEQRCVPRVRLGRQEALPGGQSRYSRLYHLHSRSWRRRHLLTLAHIQRTTTSKADASAQSPSRLTAAGVAATVGAVGSLAWYNHLYGPTLYAMTPQEEGYTFSPFPLYSLLSDDIGHLG